ncbi:MAG: metallophosphoesterase [Alphaproteobacteria bacterium]|nr:metallophosphoesterase [Alphaproteobacteria bacterium]MDE2336126.1 metallophosphoesterase [Alphaproteobacteria bacterium]
MANVLVLPKNTKGRDFVVGDIHGAYSVLKKALKQARFDPEKDRLISVGDLVDRGQQSPQCLDFLGQPWFYAVRGNHEDVFLKLCKPDGSYDAETIRRNQYNGNGMGWILKQPQETLSAIHAAFSALPMAIEVPSDCGTVGFVHAEVPAGMDWKTFKENIEKDDKPTVVSALWSRDRVEGNDSSGVQGIDRLFSGHTVQNEGARCLGNCYYVDTGAIFRLMKGIGKAPDLFLTVADICADRRDFPGAPENKDYKKVILKRTEKNAQFRKQNPRP